MTGSHNAPSPSSPIYTNPFYEIRTRVLGLSRVALARKAGVGVSNIISAERGTTLKASARVIEGLARMGVDVKTLAELPEAYLRWRGGLR